MSVQCSVPNLKELKPKPTLLPKGVPEQVPQKEFDETVLLETKRVSGNILEEFLERPAPGKTEVEEKTVERLPGKVPESMKTVEKIPEILVLEKVDEEVQEKTPKTISEKAALQRKLTEEGRIPEKLPAEPPITVAKVRPEVLSKKDTEKISEERLPSKVLDKKSKKASEAQPEQAVQALKAAATGTIEAVSTSVSLVQSVHVQHSMNITEGLMPYMWVSYIFCSFFGVLSCWIICCIIFVCLPLIFWN